MNNATGTGLKKKNKKKNKRRLGKRIRQIQTNTKFEIFHFYPPILILFSK